MHYMYTDSSFLSNDGISLHWGKVIIVEQSLEGTTGKSAGYTLVMLYVHGAHLVVPIGLWA